MLIQNSYYTATRELLQHIHEMVASHFKALLWLSLKNQLLEKNRTHFYDAASFFPITLLSFLNIPYELQTLLLCSTHKKLNIFIY